MKRGLELQSVIRWELGSGEWRGDEGGSDFVIFPFHGLFGLPDHAA